jgi:hypothetical protein
MRVAGHAQSIQNKCSLVKEESVHCVQKGSDFLFAVTAAGTNTNDYNANGNERLGAAFFRSAAGRLPAATAGRCDISCREGWGAMKLRRPSPSGEGRRESQTAQLR